ncbi:hypothetical protein Ahy_B10g104865 [Arachis hypogaea]|uniref:FAR1 domain-containing protein n=1 Tax=Arachis hypogaea TaxID=3818 RepID=A0A444X6Q4_ARAHY|nr:hypothetical protein Ahy_B10g104865 [Arachis hypogaea]
MVLTDIMLVRCACPAVSRAARPPPCLSVEGALNGVCHFSHCLMGLVRRVMQLSGLEGIRRYGYEYVHGLLLPRLEDCTLISNGFQTSSDDKWDDDEGLKCHEGRESGENSVRGAVDGNRSAGADDTAEGGLSRPVGAQDFLGKEFATKEDAYATYKEFAKLRGFGVRKGDVARVNGVLIRRDFFCHRQGTRHPKHYDRPERVREERLENRTNCKPKLKIYYDMQHSVLERVF